MQPRISLCMIVRDLQSEGLARCLESVHEHVDEILITVASDDPRPWGEVEIRERFNAKVSYFQWCDDFAAARNASFEPATGEWVMWLDDDDIVVNPEKLRFLVEEADKRGIGAYHLPYEYRHNDRGQVTVVHNRERLLRRSLGWTWRDRVHEFAVAETEHAVGGSDDVVIKHTQNKANTERNLRLLQLMEAEDPNYARMLASMGDLYQSQGKFKDAIPYLTRFYENAELSVLQWGAAVEIARCYQGLQRWDESIQWALTATASHPEYALPYLLMAHATWFGKHDADRALIYLQDADAREEAPLTHMRQPEDYTLRRWDVEHRCYAATGEWQKAWDVCMMGIKYQGEDSIQVGPTRNGAGAWMTMAWYYAERINCERSIQAADAIVDHLFRRGDTLRARRFLENDLPLSIRDDRRITVLYNRVRELTGHVMGEKDYTAFYEANHSDPEHHCAMMNGIDYEPYRMNALLARLKARGAKRVLDVGCGAGEPAMFLAENGITVVGLDINHHAITEARKRARKKFGTLKKDGTKALYKPDFRVGSIDTIGTEDIGKFDAVVMMELIEHLNPADVPLYLSSAEDMLNPGGAVIFTCPGMAVGDIPGIWYEFPRDHVQEFSRQDLESLILFSGSRRLKRPINLYKIYDPNVSVMGFASWFGEYEWQREDAPIAAEWEQPVVIYVGPGLEDWDASTPDEYGLGGSETWAIKIARELRQQGHPVIVYGMVDDVRDGVIYRNYERWDAQKPFAGQRAWLTVMSRWIEGLNERPNSERVVFVAHDVDYGEKLTPERLANMDAYCVLSEWQQQHTLAKYNDWGLADLKALADKLRIVANGIEPSFFEGETVERKEHSFIWSSSPDRGLDLLLEWWPEIREMWPDATLDVFYGWENIDGLMTQRPWLRGFKAHVEQLAQQDGVTWRGRIGQRALAKEMQQHQFWVYTSRTPFEVAWHETFCITALEAQAGGCIPVIPSSGALPERFYFGSLIEGEELTLPDVLEGLQSWDAYEGADGFIAEQRAEVLTNDWRRAAGALLAAAEIVVAKELTA